MLIDISCGNLKEDPLAGLKAIFDQIAKDEGKIIVNTILGNYAQKDKPTNPIDYLASLGIKSIWRFIISHPDFDHMDGIENLFKELSIDNVWDNQNKKPDPDFSNQKKFLESDWKFYKNIRDEKVDRLNYLKLYAEKDNPGNYMHRFLELFKILNDLPAIQKGGES